MKKFFASHSTFALTTKGALVLLVVCAAAACVTNESFIKMATGSPPFSGAIDPAKGLVRIDYRSDASGEDPAAGPDGIIKSFNRYCGADIAPQLERLKKDVQFRLGIAASLGQPQPFTCDGEICRHEALGEYDVTGEYTFINDKLRTVVFIEGGTISEQFRVDGKNFAKWFTTIYSQSNCPGY